MEFLTSAAGSLTIFVIGMAIFIVLCFTKTPRVFAVLLAAIVLSLGIDASWTVSIFTTLLNGVSAVLGAYLPMLMSGAIVGTAMSASGCAERLAKVVLKLVGTKRATLAIMVVSFAVCASGTTAHMYIVLPIALSICREANIPRGVALLAFVSQVQIVQFCLVGIAGLPNVMPAQFLGCTIYEVPVMSIIGCLLGEIIVLVICEVVIRKEHSRGAGFEVVPEIKFYEMTDPRDDASLPNIVVSVLPLVFMIGGPMFLGKVFGLDSTPCAIISQVFTTFFLLLFCKKVWVSTVPETTRMQELMSSVERALPMAVTTAFIGGMGYLISNMAWYASGIEWALSLNASPYLLAFLVVAVICLITSDGISGIQLFLSTMSERFLAIPGINVGALQRIISATACTLDSMPWTANCYNFCAFFGISFKRGWKYYFIGTVVVTTFISLFYVVYASIAWPC